MDKQKISLKFKNNEVYVIFKKIKYAHIRISQNGEIIISAPKFYDKNDILKILQTNEKWIEKALLKFQKNKLEPGKTRFLGKTFDVKFGHDGCKISENKILCFDKTSLENFKKEFLHEKILNFIQKFQPFINKKINRVTLRKMNTRWGSCNTKKGYLNFSTKLAEKPLDFIEYVVLHEMTHLIFPHHKPEFYDFIKKIMPDFRKIEKMR